MTEIEPTPLAKNQKVKRSQRRCATKNYRETIYGSKSVPGNGHGIKLPGSIGETNRTLTTCNKLSLGDETVKTYVRWVS